MSQGETEITNYTPADAFASICLYIFGEIIASWSTAHTHHSTFAQARSVQHKCRLNVVSRVIVKCEDPPANEWLEWAGGITPGHFYASDQVRLQLHIGGVCNGVSNLTCLRFRDTIIHRRLAESLVCEQFAAEFERVY